MTITIHLVRHAQGFHNLSHANERIHDPYLTPLGEQQCQDLRASFPHHEKLTHLVASPMRRTLLTCHESFAPAVLSGTNPHGKRIVAQPLVQEVSAQPCDTGSEPEVLQNEFTPWYDGALVTKGWNDKSPGSRWAPGVANLTARAREARRWLRELGREAEKLGRDADIVVVTHGGFLHFLTDDWDGMDVSKGTGWANTELRSYEFVDATGADEEASIRETRDSWKARKGEAIPLTETEQQQLRTALFETFRRTYGEVNGDAAKLS